MPKGEIQFIKINADLAKLPTWKSITKRKPALPDAEAWADVKDKLKYLER